MKIFDEKMYSLALEIVDDLMEAKESTPACELLTVLADAVDAYETVYYPIEGIG